MIVMVMIMLMLMMMMMMSMLTLIQVAQIYIEIQWGPLCITKSRDIHDRDDADNADCDVNGGRQGVTMSKKNVQQVKYVTCIQILFDYLVF